MEVKKDSFLKTIEKNYYSFKVFEGELPIEYISEHEDFRKAVVYFLAKANANYESNCGERNPYDINGFEIKKDSNGKVYMLIIGADNHARLIIRQDDTFPEDYKGLQATVVSEKNFLEIFNIFQKERVKEIASKNKIPKRFIDYKSGANVAEELGYKLVDYVKYLNDLYFDSAKVYTFEDDKNSDKHYRPRSLSSDNSKNVERVNGIIDFETRQDVLRSFGPEQAIEFQGRVNNNSIMCYIYNRNNIKIVFCEPISGESWSKIIFVNEDLTDEELRYYIKDKLELKFEDLSKESTVVKSSHTTLEAFIQNVSFLLGNEQNIRASYSFRKNVSDAVNGNADSSGRPSSR